MPAALARRTRAAITAGMVPLPGRAMPSASDRQFIELAVNMPEQEPHEGQASLSTQRSPSSSSLPALKAPTASKTELRSFPPRPASMGPPDTTMAGTLTRAAAISMPGTTLSQLGISTSASKPWASASVSMLSAMSSRDTSE